MDSLLVIWQNVKLQWHNTQDVKNDTTALTVQTLMLHYKLFAKYTRHIGRALVGSRYCQHLELLYNYTIFSQISTFMYSSRVSLR